MKIPIKNNKVTFGLVLAFGQLLMLVNATALFGEQFAEEYTNAMIGYLIFYLAFFDTLVENPTMNMSLKFALPRYAIFFLIGIIGAGFFAILQVDFLLTFLSVTLEPTNTVLYSRGVLLYQIFYVAAIEECVFRGMLPILLPDIPLWKTSSFPKEEYVVIRSEILSSLVFGIFHFTSYYFLAKETGQNLSVLMITAVLAGLIFQSVRNRFGLPSSMGLHAGINVAKLGVLGVL
ncbi:MAG: hypothetical protein AYK18_07035 [Theionarchaea archaeon DG-70]|nr:MAG: hypothetical protein AYK18_07035 [Theionarchaea archaeon DG-70]